MPSRSSWSTIAQRVLVVAEADAVAPRAGTASSTRLADVAERRVAEVVAERRSPRSRSSLSAQRARDGARDPARLERVREARAVVVALGRDEHLRLVLEPAERLGVDDPVAVALERRAQRRVRLRRERAAPGTSASRAGSVAQPPVQPYGCGNRWLLLRPSRSDCLSRGGGSRATPPARPAVHPPPAAAAGP